MVQLMLKCHHFHSPVHVTKGLKEASGYGWGYFFLSIFLYRVSQQLLCSKVPRTTLQFFLQQMLEMSPTGLKTCLDTLLHCATGVLCCCHFQCYTPTAATYRCSRLSYIPVHSNFWDTLYNVHDDTKWVVFLTLSTLQVQWTAFFVTLWGINQATTWSCILLGKSKITDTPWFMQQLCSKEKSQRVELHKMWEKKFCLTFFPFHPHKSIISPPYPSPPHLISQLAVYIKARVINWNRSTFVDCIKMNSRFEHVYNKEYLHLADQEILFSCKLKIHYHVYKISPLVPIFTLYIVLLSPHQCVGLKMVSSFLVYW
jgi:hypothetical protein